MQVRLDKSVKRMHGKYNYKNCATAIKRNQKKRSYYTLTRAVKPF